MQPAACEHAFALLNQLELLAREAGVQLGLAPRDLRRCQQAAHLLNSQEEKIGGERSRPGLREAVGHQLARQPPWDLLKRQRGQKLGGDAAKPTIAVGEKEREVEVARGVVGRSPGGIGFLERKMPAQGDSVAQRQGFEDRHLELPPPRGDEAIALLDLREHPCQKRGLAFEDLGRWSSREAAVRA